MTLFAGLWRWGMTAKKEHVSFRDGRRLPFGEWLVDTGRMGRDQVLAGLQQQRQSGGRLGEVLVRLRVLSEEDLVIALAEFLRIDRMGPDEDAQIDVELARQIPEITARRFNPSPCSASAIWSTGDGRST